MISNLKTSFYTKFFSAVVFSSSLMTIELTAQKLTPIRSTDKSSSNLEIQKIYNLTEVAKTADDYLRIIERCNLLIEQTIFEKEKTYLKSLIHWSRKRLGRRYLTSYESAKKLGLDDQAESALVLAAEQFDVIIKESPTTWRAWLERAHIHAIDGQYDHALEKFRQVVRLNLKCENAKFNCAEICLHLKKYDEAIDFYSQLIDANPTDIQALSGRGHARMAIDQVPKAIEDYEMVVKLAPCAASFFNLAAALASTELWEDAFSNFEQALKISDDETVQFQYALALIQCGDEVKGSLKRASKILEKLTQAHLDQPKYQHALKSIRTAQSEELTSNESERK